MNAQRLVGGKAYAVGSFTQKQRQAGGQAKQAAKKAGQAIKKAAPRPLQTNSGGERELWLPNAERPYWLNGTLPGDRGFDPLGLAKPQEYVQFSEDQNDQNKSYNQKGDVVGAYSAPDRYAAASIIAPWNDAFGLDRFRENEIMNGRWAMLACLGIIVGEAVTGVAWNEAGKVELDGASYFNQPLPFSIPTLVVIEVLAVGGAEVFRSQAANVEDRIYPGGVFDPLQLASDPEREMELRESEVKHCRFAMVAFAGFSAQAFYRGTGAFASIAEFASETGTEGAVPPLPAT